MPAPMGPVDTYVAFVGETTRTKDSTEPKSTYCNFLKTKICPKCNTHGSMRPMFDKARPDGTMREAGAWCTTSGCGGILVPWFCSGQPPATGKGKGKGKGNHFLHNHLNSVEERLRKAEDERQQAWAAQASQSHALLKATKEAASATKEAVRLQSLVERADAENLDIKRQLRILEERLSTSEAKRKFAVDAHSKSQRAAVDATKDVERFKARAAELTRANRYLAEKKRKLRESRPANMPPLKKQKKCDSDGQQQLQVVDLVADEEVM